MPNTGTLTGLTPATDYVLDAVHVDDWGNISGVVSSAAFTTAVADPSLTQTFTYDFSGSFAELVTRADWEYSEATNAQLFEFDGKARCEATAAGADFTARYTGGTAWTDQKATLRISNAGTNTGVDYGPVVRDRSSGSGLSGYCALYDQSAGAFTIQRLTDGAATTLGTHVAAPGTNDTIALSIIGSVLSLEINDVEVWTGSDGTHASGSVGFRSVIAAAGDYWEIDDFEGWT
jgi:hypothetical protein